MLSCERSALDINDWPVSAVVVSDVAANADVNEAFLWDGKDEEVNEAFLDGGDDGDDRVLSAIACIFSRYCCVSVIVAVGSGSILYILLRVEYASQYNRNDASSIAIVFLPILLAMPIKLIDRQLQSLKHE